jgi:hypothetical protein
MLIHAVHRPGGLFYEPRIVTLNASAPYNYISVSKPLVYGTSSKKNW